MLPTTTLRCSSLQTINRMIAEQRVHSDRQEVMDKVRIAVTISIVIWSWKGANFYDYFESSPIKAISLLILVHVQLLVRPLQKSVVCVLSHGVFPVTSRVMFPGWYGVGSSFKEFIDEVWEYRNLFADTCIKLAFLPPSLSNVDMVLIQSQHGYCLWVRLIVWRRRSSQYLSDYLTWMGNWPRTSSDDWGTRRVVAENPYLKRKVWTIGCRTLTSWNYIQLGTDSTSTDHYQPIKTS